jgi:hypothetical protein
VADSVHQKSAAITASPKKLMKIAKLPKDEYCFYRTKIFDELENLDGDENFLISQ